MGIPIVVDGQVCRRRNPIEPILLRAAPTFEKDLVLLPILAIAMARPAKIGPWVDPGCAGSTGGAVEA